MAEHVSFGRLPHGAKILAEHVAGSRTVSLGFFFATGSRYDPPGKAGCAHLAEHLVFKGTRAHSAASLARLVDRVGGDLNAWTDREELAFTCTVPATAWSTAVEALCELCLHPQFPEHEFDREKEVIRSEILAGQEDPEELSYDAFLQSVSPGDWSRPVAGTEKTLDHITLADVRRWWADFGAPCHLTIVYSGGVDPHVLQQSLAERLGEVNAAERLLPAAPAFTPLVRRWSQRAPFQQVQVVGGFTFAPPSSARQAAVWQVFSMLWGETMSSRLFQTIREQKGLCYGISSQLFDSAGRWSLQVFASCAPAKAAVLLDTLDAEVARLKTEPPTQSEWDDGQSALMGAAVIASERMENRMSRLWHQYCTFASVESAEASLRVLAQSVSGDEQAAVLAALAASAPSLLAWGPVPRAVSGRWDV